ncbi:hypothetical protein JHK87_031721 [Glycine soja]|nr:hypothetical protein JHK87_031721 [Glycine soja]
MPEGIVYLQYCCSCKDICMHKEVCRGEVPDGIDVHYLAGLIKAWFRELPTGVLDPLSSEEECAQLVRLLPPTEAALLDWAINLMADVAQMENLNNMNARNIAMVFAPNMTQVRLNHFLL